MFIFYFNFLASWICLRSQILDTSSKEPAAKTQAAVSVSLSTSDWCADADEWDEDLENGNLVTSAHNIDISDSECGNSCNTYTNSGSPDSADDADDGLDIDCQSTVSSCKY